MDDALTRLETRLTECLRELDATETQAHPTDKWSAQQIVEHLILTYDATITLLARRIAKGRPTAARPTLVQHCGQFYVVRLGLFPNGRKAPQAVYPGTALPPESGLQLASRASERLLQLNEILEETTRLFGARRKSASHLILGPLNPAQWRQFHLAHGLHHVRQVESISREHRPRS